MSILTNCALGEHFPRAAIVSIRGLAATALLTISGCSPVVGPHRFVQGRSLRPLERARESASKVIAPVDMNEAIDWIIDAAEKHSLNVSTVDRNRRVVVVTGVPGSIDTTTVGIFVHPGEESGEALLEISSWSEFARDVVRDLVTEFMATSANGESGSTTRE